MHFRAILRSGALRRLYELEFGREFPAGPPWVQNLDAAPWEGRIVSTNLADARFSFAVIRDPMQRLESAWKSNARPPMFKFCRFC